MEREGARSEHLRRADEGGSAATDAERPGEQLGEVEIGWLLIGRLDEVDRGGVKRALHGLVDLLRQQLPEFSWRMELVEHLHVRQPVRVEPAPLIERGIVERDARGWDCVLVVTGGDLVAYTKPFAVAVPSRAAGVAVLSTARLDPDAEGEKMDTAERESRIARRLSALALRVLGDLTGLSQDAGDGASFGSAMAPIRTMSDLDRVEGYSPETLRELRAQLREIADQRLEERRRPPKVLSFYAQVAWMNLRGILGSSLRARPWELPFRLSRLTAAAVSALVIQLITSESWAVALRLSPRSVALLSCAVLVAGAAFIIKRQHLLISHRPGQITEQIATSHITVTLTVILGLIVAYALLFSLTLALGLTLFPREMIASWSDLPKVDVERYVRLAGFVAAIGLAVGTLGASFEDQSYFRQVTYADEEI